MSNEPWFFLPIVTRWKKTEEGLEAVETTKFRVDIKGMPSLKNLSEEEAWLMAGLYSWESEQVPDNG